MIRLAPVSHARATDMVEAVAESLADLEPWMPWASAAYSIATANQWIDEIASQGHEFCVLDADGRFLGNVGVNAIRTDNRIANLGYWIRSSCRGQGFAVEAVHALLSWVRQNTDLNRLEIVVATGNSASRRVAEKSGAHFEGIARSRLLLHGQYHDAAMYSFAREDTPRT